MTSLELTGLDAQNPLGFLASLGLLRVLDWHAVESGTPHPRLSFVDVGRITPRLSTSLSLEEVIELVLKDAAAQSDNLVLQLAYDENGARVPPGTRKSTRDLKPSPEAAKELLGEAAATSTARVARLAGSMFSELVQDNNGNTKPTGLHFTAGKQLFLDMVEKLRVGITTEDVKEALVGPWKNESTLPSLTWDASVARLYALRAGDPSKEKRGSIPAANWLGVIALEFFPVAVRRGRLVTTGIVGGWKDSIFRWPVWKVEATLPTVAGLLRTDCTRLSHAERVARGILGVFSSNILRSDQGGYGSFTPAAVVLPRSTKKGSAFKPDIPPR